jgi:hypothetical protein
VKIPIYRYQAVETGKVLLDRSEQKKVKGKMITLSATGYPMVSTGRSGGFGRNWGATKLHHFLFGKPPKGKVWDHINFNKLDCRRKNLRLVTPSDNTFHRRGAQPNNSTGIRGVYRWTDGKGNFYWVAKAVKNKKQYIKYFKTKKEAARAVVELREEILSLEQNTRPT